MIGNPSLNHRYRKGFYSLFKTLQQNLLGKCFSDFSRIKIFYALETYKEMCVCDLAEILTASVATTSHHLRFLKKHGMAKSRQDGKVVYYSLANEDILSAIRVF
ncbi:ArsR/SmtB family transcription factor [Enterococcus faecium]|uniref:ArsR/SmtB family transcription factor n=1 Tax=Enterococcus faecium TaxID=1352 RepID=UPI002B4B9D55|nr:metalloregulator ArsR/SmtB family transcription factor [Enterococcus faecium]